MANRRKSKDDAKTGKPETAASDRDDIEDAIVVEDGSEDATGEPDEAARRAAADDGAGAADAAPEGGETEAAGGDAPAAEGAASEDVSGATFEDPAAAGTLGGDDIMTGFAKPDRPDLAGGEDPADDGAVASETGPGAFTMRDDAEDGDRAVQDPGAGDATRDTDTARDASATGGRGDALLPPATAPTMQPPPQEARRGGAFGVILGGVIAACIGAAALYLAQAQGWIGTNGGTAELQARLDAQAETIAALQSDLGTASTEIEGLRGAEPDLSEVNAALETLQSGNASVTEQLEAVETALTALVARVDDIETQPIPEAELPAEIVSAYERQLAEQLGTIDGRFQALQTEQADRFAALEAAMNEKLAAMEQAQADAAAAQTAAAEAARIAEARAAIAQIEVALDTGAAYATEVETLRAMTGTEVPPALAEPAETGVPTLADLQDRFPEAARLAIADATRAAADEGQVDRVTAFLRTQLGARSLEPREGDDADAVLSRAESALAGGDLDRAIRLVESLDEPGRGAFEDWLPRARTRAAALEAAATLRGQIETN